MSSKPIDNISTPEKPLTIKAMLDENTNRHIIVKKSFNDASKEIDNLFGFKR